MVSSSSSSSSFSNREFKKLPNSSSPNVSAFKKLCRKLFSSKQSPKASMLPITDPIRDDVVICNDHEVIIRRLFNYFDENGDGKISAPELQSCMNRTVGGDLSLEEVEMAVSSSDSDEGGVLVLEDFAKLMKSDEVEEEEDLREAFGMYAAEETGCITPKSLKRMMSRLGESTSLRECEVMIREFDLNGDGVLNFDEFKKMMTMR